MKNSAKIAELLEHISRYPQPYEQEKFIKSHPIEITDFGVEYPNASFDIESQRKYRRADYKNGEDKRAYVGVSQLDVLLADWSTDDIYSYLQRRNSPQIAYQDSRDEFLDVASDTVRINEEFSKGMLKLKSGETVLLSDKEAKLINKLFRDLNTQNRKTMEKVLKTDKAGFEEILGFAKEAL